MKINKKILVGVVSAALVVIVGVTAGYGAINYSGPLRYLSVVRILLQNPPEEHQGGIVFYGASNFRLWDTMEEDMASYGYPEVVNNGFGGCSDEDLIRYAPQLLFPYEPEVVFIQTGSNDYALSGLDAEEVKKNKVEMYSYFAENLPDTTFIVMSGLPLPGRTEYWDNIQTVNAVIEEYCAETERFYYVDSNPASSLPQRVHGTAAGRRPGNGYPGAHRNPCTGPHGDARGRSAGWSAAPDRG